MFHNGTSAWPDARLQPVVKRWRGRGALGRNFWRMQGRKTQKIALPPTSTPPGKVQRFAAVRLLGEAQERIHVDGAQLAGVRFQRLDDPPNHPAGHRQIVFSGVFE